MARHHDDFIKAYIRYTEGGEAPTIFHFWCAVSTMAGALRRRVWLDFKRFKWYPNFYILLVAPPGIVQKSTTMDLGMSILRKVPDIVMGPHIATWESLVTKFAQGAETFNWNGDDYTQSPITLAAGEFGNLFDPDDRKMVDVFTRLWDCPDGPFEKETKSSGCDTIINPWMNLIAATTVSWIGENCTRYIIGGGFMSRCIVVYADQKKNLVAYPDETVDPEFLKLQKTLLADLITISEMKGEFSITKEAREWGRAWYAQHYNVDAAHLNASLYGGYIARKQVHIHKLAMILSAARGESMVIGLEDLQVAEQMVTGLESPMKTVFESVGKGDAAHRADILLAELRRCGEIEYSVFYHRVYSQFPKAYEFEDIMSAAINSGRIRKWQEGMTVKLKFIK